MAGPYDIFVLGGQSNAMYAYGYDAVDKVAGPNIYQITQNQTIVAATQCMDFPGLNGGSANLISFAVNFLRDYYIPNKLQAGRDCLIVPVAQGGAGYYLIFAYKGGQHDPSPEVGYTNTKTLINAVLAASAGSVVKAMFWQHGEEDVGDAAVPEGYYTSMSMGDGYTRYTSEMLAGLHSDITGGFDQVPFIVGALPHDECAVSTSADGHDHHNSNNNTMLTAQAALPSNIRKCGFVDTNAPFKLVTEAETNPSVTQYWLHYSQESHKVLAHRYWKKYLELTDGTKSLTSSYPRIVCTPTYAGSPSHGTKIGDLSVTGGSGSYAYTLLDDGGGRIQLNGVTSSQIEMGATVSVAPTPQDPSTATSAYSFTVKADNGSRPVINKFIVHYAKDTYTPNSVGSPGAESFRIVNAA